MKAQINNQRLRLFAYFLILIPICASANFEIKIPCPDNSSIDSGLGKMTRFYSSMQAFSNDKPRCILNVPLLSKNDVASAELTHHPQTNDIIVNIEFSASGKQILNDYSTKHIGQTIALMVDGKILTVPTIQGPIEDGLMQIQGLWYEDAVRLARSINQNSK